MGTRDFVAAAATAAVAGALAFGGCGWCEGGSSSGDAPVVEPAAVGVAWHGSFNGARDFSLAEPRTASDVTTFVFSSWPRGLADGGELSGTAQVVVASRKVKVRLSWDDGTPARLLDGVFSTDGRLVGGLAYTLPDGRPSRGGTPWWATVEQTEVAPPTQVSIESVSVGTLASVLPHPRDAWPVVEQRLRSTGPPEIDDLEIGDDTRARLRELTHAR